MSHSPSPPRKQKQLTQIPSLPQYFKSLPINLPEEIVSTINTLSPINESFKQHLHTLSVYRSNLGSQIQANWIQMLNFSRKLIYQIDNIFKRKEKQQKQIVEYMTSERQKMDDQIRQLKYKLSTMTSLKDVQQSQAQEAMVEVETLKKEISQIHKIVQKDMDKVMQYLIVLEKSPRTEVSNEIFNCLERLALSLNRLDDESNTSHATLKTMEQVIKAMARNNKTDAFTQLQENELESKAQMIFPESKQKIDMERLAMSNFNLSSQLNRDVTNKHILDQLRIKEYDYPPEAVSKKNPEKSWVLPPTIILFLQNMAKQNQNGKVLPWQYVKKIIYQIYSQRINHKKQILAGLIGNAVPMDQFLVMLFIRKYNMRRLAELKLLEFLISVKYYTKFWQKAETFAAVLDIMRINPYFEINDTNVYKFDIYVQHFFFHVLSQFDKTDLSEEEDGSTFIQLEVIKNKLRPLLCFCEELNRSRLFAKLEKTIRLQQKVEYVDFDLAIHLSIQEYFFHRKNHMAEINKSFVKVNQLTEGYFSIKQVASIFQQFEEGYRVGEQTYACRYPASSGLQLCKLYLYAITSSKNGFSISAKDFSSACQRFGFDCPIPFLHQCNPNNKRKSRLERTLSLSPKKTISQDFMSAMINPNQMLLQNLSSDVAPNFKQYHRMESLPLETKQSKQNPYSKRIEIGSTIFSQHFTILRQLMEYCKIFKAEMSKETDSYILWNQFNNIMKVLQKGCQFVKYPLKH